MEGRLQVAIIAYIMAVGGTFSLSYLIVELSLFEACSATWIIGFLVGFIGTRWVENNIGQN